MKDATRVVVILDRSGSMVAIRKATVDSFNEFVNSQKSVPGQCFLELVQFDSPYEKPEINVTFSKPLGEVPVLTEADYQPRGMTPLHDAMGVTITRVGAELEQMNEAERPNKVMVITITDGQENASSDYDRKRIADLIKQQDEVYNWQFVFLGANQDAVLAAKGFNIDAQNAMTYNANRASYMSMNRSVSAMALDYRKMATPTRSLRKGLAFTKSDRDKARQ